MNLNALARHGAFGVEGVTGIVTARLADGAALAKARVLPYQLMATMGAVGAEVSAAVKAALETAFDASLVRVPKVEGRVIVCPDVSGSMGAPVTGYRKGATTSVRCIDVAALVASAMLRRNPATRVLPFAQEVVHLPLDGGATVAANAARLAAIGGGGTNVSAPP